MRLAVGTWIAATLAGAAIAQGAPETFCGWGTLYFDTEDHLRTDIVAVDAGSDHTLLLYRDGRISAWGANDLSKCEAPQTGVFTAVAAGAQHSTALRSNGDAMSWGSLTYPTGSIPLTVPGCTAIDAGISHGVYLLANGSVSALGSNQFGQAPGAVIPPAGTAFVAVAAGAYHTLAILSNGAIRAWGNNSSGQCNVPSPPTGVSYVQVAGGVAHSVALRSDGTVVAWGSNANGQLGVPSLPPGVLYVEVTSGYDCCLARRSDGVVVGWGQTLDGQLNVPSLPSGEGYAQLSCGFRHVVARTTAGRVIAWGHNGELQCNLPLPPAGTRYLAVAGTRYELMVLRDDGVIDAFGTGIGTLPLSQPPPLPPGVTYTAVEGAGPYFLGLRSDGRLTGWGRPFTVPSAPAGVHYTAISVAAVNADFGIALRSDGLADVWSITAATAPPAPPLPPGMSYTAVAAGIFMLALRSDGQAMFWSRTFPAAPLPLPSGLRYLKVHPGVGNPVLIRSDGQTYSPNLNLVPVPSGAAIDVVAGNQTALTLSSEGRVFSTRAGVMTERMPPPGRAFARIGGWSGQSFFAARSTPASCLPLGPGCGGSGPAPRLVPQDAPRLGQPHRMSLLDLPQDAAFVLTGLSSTASAFGPLPFDTAPLGIPGCRLRTSVELIQLVFGSGGSAEHTLQLAPSPALLGAQFHQQAVVVDPAAGNAFGAVLSDAWTSRVGS